MRARQDQKRRGYLFIASGCAFSLAALVAFLGKQVFFDGVGAMFAGVGVMFIGIGVAYLRGAKDDCT